jgi:hypothetical protein
MSAKRVNARHRRSTKPKKGRLKPKLGISPVTSNPNTYSVRYAIFQNPEYNEYPVNDLPVSLWDRAYKD